MVSNSEYLLLESAMLHVVMIDVWHEQAKFLKKGASVFTYYINVR